MVLQNSYGRQQTKLQTENTEQRFLYVSIYSL
jgi:hypothetical protein